MNFIDCIEFLDKRVLVQKIKSDGLFASMDEKDLETDSLIKYKIVNLGTKCVLGYNLEDVVLIRADLVKKVKYSECSEDILTVGNEDLIFGKLKKNE